MSTYYLVHRRGGSTQKDWFPRLKKYLIQQGHLVVLCQMPHPNKPTIDEWVSSLDGYVSPNNQETIFIGHSIGCQTIMRYLEQKNVVVGVCIFVAPWFDLIEDCISDTLSKQIAKPRLETPICTDYLKKI